MEIRKLHKSLVSSRWIFFLTIFWAFAARLLTGITFESWTPWLVLAIQLGIGFLLLQVNYEFTIIPQKTFLPLVFYLLFTTSDVTSYGNLSFNIAALLLTLSVYLGFKSYQEPKSQAASFDIAFLLTLGSVFCWRPLLLLIPVFWFGFYQFSSLNIKTFLASLLGICSVYLFVFVWSIYTKDFYFLSENIIKIVRSFDFEWIELDIVGWVIYGYLTLLCVANGANIFVFGLSERVRTIRFYQFLYFLALFLLIIMCAFNPTKGVISLLIYLPVSLIVSYLFTMIANKWTVGLFIFTIVLFLLSTFLSFPEVREFFPL